LIAKGDFVKKEILQKLGYTEQDRILVINGDDFGMCHAANVGTAKFLSDFPGNSATLMVPCPWAYEAIQM
jgi:chitin disaccharide deacetylase